MKVLGSSLISLVVVSCAFVAEAATLDVSDYDKIYIRYHNCAWSPYSEDCGADNGGDLWYLALTQCFRANAAYSLYGVPSGAEDKGCSKGTFINSYFTTAGVESFIETLQNAGVAVNQEGENQEEEDGDEANGEQLNAECQVIENENQEEQQDDGAVDWSANNRKMYDGSTSYGLGCYEGNFAMKTFGGAFCDERTAVRVDNELTEFNEGLEAAECVIIYDGPGQNDDANEQAEEEEELELLQNSEPCNVRFYPKSCPDPYGKLSFASRSISRDVARLNQPVAETVKMLFSWLFLSLGTIFIGASAWAMWNKSNNNPKLDLDDASTGAKSAKSSTGWMSSKKGNANATTRSRRCRLWNPFRRASS